MKTFPEALEIVRKRHSRADFESFLLEQIETEEFRNLIYQLSSDFWATLIRDDDTLVSTCAVLQVAFMFGMLTGIEMEKTPTPEILK